MTETIKLTKENEAEAIQETVNAVREKKIILYPTDTVYGIGGDATSDDVVAKIYEIKKRGEAKPLSIALADFASISKYCEVSPSQEEILKQCLPGPYTFILRLKKEIAASQTEKIGVRIPDNNFIRSVISAFGRPIITTSANLSGYREAFSFEDVEKIVLEKCDLAIDSGPTKYKQASTVFDLIQRKLLRQGAGRIRVF